MNAVTRSLRFAPVLLAVATAAPLAAQPMMPSPAREVGWTQNTGTKLPLDATFRDENGKTVRLGDYFGKRPVVLSLAYYECPMLCGIALEGLARSLKGFTLTPGEDFEVVTLSFNPAERPPLAREKKTNLVGYYGRKAEGEAGWHFLTGDETQIPASPRPSASATAGTSSRSSTPTRPGSSS